MLNAERKALSAGNGKPPFDICERTFQFAVRIVQMAKTMPRGIASEVITRQLVRSGTGVGANVEEAQGAGTRKDFARKMNIARDEARETHYWLRLVKETGLLKADRMAAIIPEAEELSRVLTTIVQRTRRNSAGSATISRTR